jgi:hypothetical protein
MSSIGFFIVVTLLIGPVRLPWLGKDRVAADITEEDQINSIEEDSTL